MRINLSAAFLSLAMLAGLTLFVGEPVGAQTTSAVYQGSFTLPYDVDWNGRFLPAGEYHFTLTSHASSDVLTIKNEKEKTVARVMPVGFSGAPAQQNELHVVTVDGKHYIRTLCLTFISSGLNYHVPKQSPAEAESATMALVIPIKKSRPINID